MPGDKTETDEPTNDAAIEDFLRRRGRYRNVGQYVVYRPEMCILTATDAESLSYWRGQLRHFLAAAQLHREQLEPEYQVNLREWVSPAVWRAISRNLLYGRDRTNRRDEVNHAAVEDFLRCRGRYEDQGEYEVSDTDSENEAAAASAGPSSEPHLMQVCSAGSIDSELSSSPLQVQRGSMQVQPAESDDSEDSSMPPLVSASATSSDEDETSSYVSTEDNDETKGDVLYF